MYKTTDPESKKNMMNLMQAKTQAKRNRKSARGIRIRQDGKMVREFKIRLDVQTDNLDMTVIDMYKLLLRALSGSDELSLDHGTEPAAIFNCEIDYLTRRDAK